MSDSNPDARASRTSFRPFWTMFAVFVVFMMEVLRYVGSKGPEKQEPASTPRPVPRIARVELEQDESLPHKGESVILSGLDEAGVWVSLEPGSFSDMSIFLQRGEQDQLIHMRDAQRIARVPNRTKATVIEGSVLHYQVKLLEGEHADRHVTVEPRFVHRPEEEAANLEREARSPAAGQFTLQNRNGKLIFGPLKEEEE